MELYSVDDWEPWCRHIQRSVRSYDVWKYVDPAVKDEDLPKPEEKTRPKPEDYMAPERIANHRKEDSTKAITVRDLSREEKESYMENLDDFRWEIRRHEEGMKRLLDMIRRSVPPWARPLVARQVQPRKILLILRSRFERTEEEQLIHRGVVRSKWAHMRAYTPLNTRGKIEAWCGKWSILYREGRKLGIFSYDEHPIEDFMHAITAHDLGFWSDYRQKLRKGNTIDFTKMVYEFMWTKRDEITLRYSRTDDEDNPRKQPKDKTSKKRRSCLVCNQGHSTTKCWALNRKEAPKYWSLSEKTRGYIKRNLHDDDTCRLIIETYQWNRPKVKIECLIEEFWYWEGYP
ncbi:hypothetical protein ASPSYDRAFT_35155 [Aspergillus sydowii CBS 593.65]|uniref:Uncharacterized protein n=1 Tax=Aspergillus sydowii CBS 593.65 TaxID=1036612 RepID=A0A1L9T4U1_9EURO|nr:uncharacterized protein ASPSYDRAFT_35155 [Aspergillus sydowii CBS 593.65]OJJ54449.1 hypothetical protein ASPSYDRAFT_35155 [Aspergillus sydowii CBS 593.65]